jgi:hypothetical protein
VDAFDNLLIELLIKRFIASAIKVKHGLTPPLVPV